jgi:hypothetical protein
LLVRGYQITEIPPTKSDLAYPLCGTSVEPFINATWDYEQNLFGDCGWDSFMLHYTGYIQIPVHETIEFWIASDDGGTVKIGSEEFGVWQDQGCSATETGLIDIEAGTHELDAWFYENGGGTCFMLAWNIDDTGWEIVQPEFFTSEPLTPETTSTLETTTTESSTTSTTSTTSFVQKTTTTESETTTTQPPQTTTSIYLPTTTATPQTTTALPQTTSSTTLYVSSTTSLLDQPTTTQPTPAVSSSTIPQTTTTTSTTTTTLFIPPLPSSPQPQPSLPATTEPTTSPAQTLPPIQEPTTSVQTTQPAPTTTTSTIPPDPSTSVPKPPETSTSVELPTTTSVPSDEPISDEQFAEALTALSEATPDQVTEIVDTILASEVTSDQATQLVASVEILSAVTPEQAQQLFEQVEETQLSESMAAVISDAMNDPAVPDEVKEAFEDTLNIFGNNGFATYVPLGSNVNVAVRRTIVAGTTILVSLPSPAPARRT